MIILSIATAIAAACAIYFAVRNGKLSSTIEDKEMVLLALRRQSESDKLKIAELLQRISHLETRATATVEAVKPAAPRKSRKPKTTPQA